MQAPAEEIPAYQILNPCRAPMPLYPIWSGDFEIGLSATDEPRPCLGCGWPAVWPLGKRAIVHSVTGDPLCALCSWRWAGRLTSELAQQRQAGPYTALVLKSSPPPVVPAPPRSVLLATS